MPFLLSRLRCFFGDISTLQFIALNFVHDQFSKTNWILANSIKSQNFNRSSPLELEIEFEPKPDSIALDFSTEKKSNNNELQ